MHRSTETYDGFQNRRRVLKSGLLMSSRPDETVEVVMKDKKRCRSDDYTLAKSFGHARDLKTRCGDSVSPELSPADFCASRHRKRFRHSTGTPALVNDACDEMSSRCGACEEEDRFQTMDSKNDMEVDSRWVSFDGLLWKNGVSRRTKDRFEGRGIMKETKH